MADSEFERFKKKFPGGKKDINILAIPAPLPGPGGLGRAIVGRGAQSVIRRFSDVTKADKVTQMKGRDGLARKPMKKPEEPKVVESGRSKALEKTRQGGGGPTKMKDRKGLERKDPMEPKRSIEPKPESKPVSRSFSAVPIGSAPKGMIEAKSGVAKDRSKPMSTASVQESYQQLNRKHGTQRPVTEVSRAIPIPRAKPDRPKKDAKPKAKPVAKKSAPKAKAKAKPAIRFKGNWQNAAPTAMQARMGQRIKRKGLFS